MNKNYLCIENIYRGVFMKNKDFNNKKDTEILNEENLELNDSEFQGEDDEYFDRMIINYYFHKD